MLNNAFPTGSVYGVGKKQKQQKRWMLASSESSSILNIMHIVKKKTGPICHCLDWLNFNFHHWYGFKFKSLKNKLKKNYSETVRDRAKQTTFWDHKHCQWSQQNIFEHLKKRQHFGITSIVNDHSKTFLNI